MVGVGRNKHSETTFSLRQHERMFSGKVIIMRRERKKYPALDITQHNNGTATHYFQRLVAAEQLSTELSGRSRWKAPHGAASGNNGDCRQPAGDHFSLMVHGKATVCLRKY